MTVKLLSVSIWCRYHANASQNFVTATFFTVFKLCRNRANVVLVRNRSVPYRSVPKSGTLKGCVHTGTLEITSFRSKKWNDRISDAKSGTIRNSTVPFPCEQAMRCKTGAKKGTIRFLP